VKLKQAEMEEEILKGLIYFVYVPSSPGRALGKKILLKAISNMWWWSMNVLKRPLSSGRMIMHVNLVNAMRRGVV